MAIIKVPGLYSRQDVIAGLHPPERVLVYMTAGAESENATSNRAHTLLAELIEGLVLIGCLDITVIAPLSMRRAIATGGVSGVAWIERATRIINECRPYVNMRLSDAGFAKNNAAELDVDDVIFIHAGTPSTEDLEFAAEVEDAYVADADTFDVLRVKRPAVVIAARGTERRVTAAKVEAVAVSAQALLLVNMLAKPGIYKRTGVGISAKDFIEKVAVGVAETLGVAGYKQRREARQGRPAVLSTAVRREATGETRSEELLMEIKETLSREGVSTLTNLAKKVGVNPATMRTRLKLGWTLARAMGR